jgi:integrase
VLHQALRAAERLGLVARDVSGRVDRPRVKTAEMQPLSREETNQFLRVARQEKHWLEPLYRLALTTGMREGELLALKWRDVEVESQRLAVVASLIWRHYEPIYSLPKTHRSRRQIAIPVEMVEVLQAQRQWQRKQRVRVGPAWQGERYDCVFSDELGFPLHAERVVYQFRKVLRASGLPTTVRFHDLRHTFATLQLANGVHPKIVSETLGHATVNMTLDRYSHVLPHMQEAAARAIGDALDW